MYGNNNSRIYLYDYNRKSYLGVNTYTDIHNNEIRYLQPLPKKLPKF